MLSVPVLVRSPFLAPRLRTLRSRSRYWRKRGLVSFYGSMDRGGSLVLVVKLNIGGRFAVGYRRINLFFAPIEAYIGSCRRKPSMAINSLRNKPIRTRGRYPAPPPGISRRDRFERPAR